ncbi:MAG: hypothetical protein QM526_01110 [Alphaproteobacteria bacterium]|nr:hypothetical protein [Alphaproteobacteria bacterium]
MKKIFFVPDLLDYISKEKSVPMMSDFMNDVENAFMDHSFEVESINKKTYFIELSILPNRYGDCLTKEGMAREFCAIMNLPFSGKVEMSDRKIEVSTVFFQNFIDSNITEEIIKEKCKRLYIECVSTGNTLVFTPPKDRIDLETREDIAEEITRMIGFKNISSVPLANNNNTYQDPSEYKIIRKIILDLNKLGFTEIMTRTFTNKKGLEVLRPVASDKSFLRQDLSELQEVGKKNEIIKHACNKEEVKIFEIGKVFSPDGKESLELAWYASKKLKDEESEKLKDCVRIIKDIKSKNYNPVVWKDRGDLRMIPIRFSIIKRTPYIERDLSIYVPVTSTETTLIKEFKDVSESLKHFVTLYCFDTFEKEGKKSFAFRFVFQDAQKTLTDSDINIEMDKVYQHCKKNEYIVR